MRGIGSLFSGIGGLELGLERAGLGPVLWQVESDPFCRDILARHWPDATLAHDVIGFCAPELGLPWPRVICGGFPCQDVSVAGRGAGMTGARSGLWAEFARIVDECQPEVVVVENVAQGSSRWLPRVCSDLEELGYVPCPIALSAEDCGAPHRRSRIFVVADTDGSVLRLVQQREPGGPPGGVRDSREAEPVDDGCGGEPSWSSPWSALPDMGRMVDGVPAWMDDRRRSDRLRVLGNAVVPAQAYAVGLLVAAALGLPWRRAVTGPPLDPPLRERWGR